MKVWVVHFHEWHEGSTIKKVFDSKEKAEKYTAEEEEKVSGPDINEVEEMDIE